MRFHLLLSLTLFSFTSLLAPSEGAKCGGAIHHFSHLTSVTAQEFEAFFPFYENSLRSEAPETYSQVMALFRKYPTFHEAFEPDGIAQGTPYEDLLERIREYRNEIADRMLELGDEIERKAVKAEKKFNDRKRPFDDLATKRREVRAARTIAKDLEFMSKRFRITPEHKGQLSLRIGWERFTEVKNDLRGEFFYPNDGSGRANRALRTFYSFANIIYAFWGELRVSLCVPALSDLHNQLRNLDPLKDQVRAAQAINRISEMEAVQSIDVVFRGGGDGLLVFAAVMSFRKPLNLNSTQFEYALAELEKYIAIVKKLNLKNVRVSLFLLNGIHADAKNEILARYRTVGIPVDIVAQIAGE